MPNTRIEEFRVAAAGQGIAGAEVYAFLGYARFYVSLPVVPEGLPPVDGPVAGRKGGLPVLPPDLAWPVGPSGRPLPFHGLVDCAALPRSERLDLQLPVSGYFLFFTDFDNTMINYEDYEGTGGGFEREQEAARLIFVPGGVPVAERPVPVVGDKPVFHAFPVVELRAVIDIDVPGLPEDEHSDVPHWAALRQLAEQVWRGWYGDRDIRLGGFALTPQTEPTDIIAEHEHQTTGGDAGEDEWVPLAQLGSEDPIESATLARFLARRADIAAGDFSRVVSVAEFMD